MGRVASITVLAGDGYDGEEVLGASWKRVVANSTQPEHIRHPWLRCSFPDVLSGNCWVSTGC